MISMQELLGNHKLEDQTNEIQVNLKLLLTRVNLIRTWWNKPMIVTSGLRTMQDHLRIYAALGKYPPNVPLKSKHLVGAAVDISDPDLSLTTWLKKDTSYLENAKLWCEEGNKNWVHFQCFSPNSGKRWFLP